MARTYDDELVVRTAPEPEREGWDDGGAAAGRPEAFLWHGRLHVVRQVLCRWYERRAWWEQDPQRAEETVPAGAAGPGATGGTTGGTTGGATGALPSARRPTRTPALDREVWRVEASAGRQGGTGVYELCHEDAPSGGTPDGGWSLRRVDD